MIDSLFFDAFITPTNDLFEATGALNLDAEKLVL